MLEDNQMEPIPQILRSLRVFHQILSDMAEALGKLSKRAKGPLSFHASLAHNRIRMVAENLGEALSLVGVSTSKRMGEDEIYKEAGSIAVEALEGMREIVGLIESINEGKAGLSHLIPYLKKYMETVDLVTGVLRVYIGFLEEDGKAEVRNLAFALHSTIQDLTIVRQRHEQLIKMFNHPGQP
ncbi:MAG: hypothetical protein ACXQTF_00305 [Candidatus Hecatellaceae archaeon]